MKDTEPLPYKSKCIHSKVETVGTDTVKVYRLIDESVNDLIRKILSKLRIK
jgi:hypothetical protein